MTLLKQPRARRQLVAEALRELLRAWWLVRFREFRTYSSALGEAHPAGFTTEFAHGEVALLSDIRWAIDAINRTVGGRFTCLMQAMAGKAMLNRRGMENTLVLGAKLKRDKEDGDDAPMAAHAWLRVGRTVVLGGEASVGYVPVASYHSAK
ncbi:lasso peptide biosynthesis B2 protein [Roseibacterium sp. SDUM158016]|uniref:lasso peptide biosynthesis B2 protein n=1 Tax=Roseicyclus sediminis TaxID=2980997 RepID=UPI0021CE66A9|nr:lasso peptide biosynthesis B2 protein [Roseibacterium sp. SDUM158016]MCU4653924.1 lasso peptide biosynthesis B2 protein [Roseibacterium sp. SDUM158016]